MFLLWLRQFPPCGDGTPASVHPPAEGKSSPTNIPVFFFFPLVPSSYWVLRGSIYSFPLVRSSCLLSVGVQHAFLSEGVFLMYPWREVCSTSTYSAILFCNHFPCFWYFFWSLFMALAQLNEFIQTGLHPLAQNRKVWTYLWLQDILREQENYDLSIVKSCKPLRTIYIM